MKPLFIFMQTNYNNKTMFRLHLVAAFIFLILAILLSCNSSKTSDARQETPTDTIQTMALYTLSPGEIRINWVYRVSKDTFKLTEIDKETAKKTWTRDTQYYIPVTDTVRDKRTGKPLPDSSGKYKMETYYPPLPRTHIIHDYMVNSKELYQSKK